MALPSLGRMSDGSLTSRSDSDSEEVGKGHFITVLQHLHNHEEERITKTCQVWVNRWCRNLADVLHIYLCQYLIRNTLFTPREILWDLEKQLTFIIIIIITSMLIYYYYYQSLITIIKLEFRLVSRLFKMPLQNNVDSMFPSFVQPKLPLNQFYPYIHCALCCGFLIDATTITECLHTCEWNQFNGKLLNKT